MADKGVSAGSPADLFENLSEGEAAMLPDPFPSRPLRLAGPGRPAGSANKRTLKMRELYLKMGLPHPMLWQGAMLARSVPELAAALDCTPLEAAEMQRKIASDLAPFLESKMPVEVTGRDGERLPVLMVGEVRAIGASVPISQRPDGAMAIDDDLAVAIEQYQRVSAEDAARSHGEGSHARGEAADIAGEKEG